jgi:copper chaperone CopZ
MSSSATYDVQGMTCGHCVSAVTEELTGLDGVTAVSVDLTPGGTSTVTVTSDAPLDAGDVRAAVDEAGYEVV